MGRLNLECSNEECRQAVDLAAANCPRCGAVQRGILGTAGQHGGGRWVADGEASSVPARGSIVLHPAFGGLLVTDPQGTRLFDDSDSARPGVGLAQMPEWLSAVTTAAGDGPIEFLPVGRWLVARTDDHLHVLPGILLNEPLVSAESFPCKRPLDVGDLLTDTAQKPVGQRLASMARLALINGAEAHWLATLSSKAGSGATAITFFRIESESADTPWKPKLTASHERLLEGDGWWLDRGALNRGARLLACRPGEAVIVSADADVARGIKVTPHQLPNGAEQQPGLAAMVPRVGLVVAGRDSSNRTAGWLLHHDQAAYPLDGVPPNLDGLDPVGSGGVRGRAGAQWLNFLANPAGFTTGLDPHPMAEVHASPPGAVVYRSNAAQRPLVRLADQEAELPLTANAIQLKVALEGPRLWTAALPPDGAPWSLQAWRWMAQ